MTVGAYFAGVGIALCTTLMSAGGMILQKISQRRNLQEIADFEEKLKNMKINNASQEEIDKVLDEHQKPRVWKQTYWLLGIVLMIVSSLLSLAVFALVGQAVASCFAAVTLIWNVILARFVLKERISKLEFVTTSILICGAVITVTFGAQSNPDERQSLFTYDEINKIFNREVVYIFSAAIGFVFAMAIVWVYLVDRTRERGGTVPYWLWMMTAWWRPFLGAVLSATTGICSKGFTSIVSQIAIDDADNVRAIVSRADLWLFLGFLPISLILQVSYLNSALRYFDASLVVPIYQSMIVVMGVVFGFVYWNEGGGLGGHIAGFICGIVLIVFGLSLLLLKRRNRPMDEVSATLSKLLEAPPNGRARSSSDSNIPSAYGYKGSHMRGVELITRGMGRVIENRNRVYSISEDAWSNLYSSDSIETQPHQILRLQLVNESAGHDFLTFKELKAPKLSKEQASSIGLKSPVSDKEPILSDSSVAIDTSAISLEVGEMHHPGRSGEPESPPRVEHSGVGIEKYGSQLSHANKSHPNSPNLVGMKHATSSSYEILKPIRRNPFLDPPPPSSHLVVDIHLNERESILTEPPKDIRWREMLQSLSNNNFQVSAPVPLPPNILDKFEKYNAVPQRKPLPTDWITGSMSTLATKLAHVVIGSTDGEGGAPTSGVRSRRASTTAVARDSSAINEDVSITVNSGVATHEKRERGGTLIAVSKRLLGLEENEYNTPSALSYSNDRMNASYMHSVSQPPRGNVLGGFNSSSILPYRNRGASFNPSKYAPNPSGATSVISQASTSIGSSNVGQSAVSSVVSDDETLLSDIEALHQQLNSTRSGVASESNSASSSPHGVLVKPSPRMVPIPVGALLLSKESEIAEVDEALNSSFDTTSVIYDPSGSSSLGNGGDVDSLFDQVGLENEDLSIPLTTPTKVEKSQIDYQSVTSSPRVPPVPSSSPTGVSSQNSVPVVFNTSNPSLNVHLIHSDPPGHSGHDSAVSSSKTSRLENTEDKDTGRGRAGTLSSIFLFPKKLSLTSRSIPDSERSSRSEINAITEKPAERSASVSSSASASSTLKVEKELHKSQGKLSRARSSSHVTKSRSNSTVSIAASGQTDAMGLDMMAGVLPSGFSVPVVKEINDVVVVDPRLLVRSLHAELVTVNKRGVPSIGLFGIPTKVSN